MSRTPNLPTLAERMRALADSGHPYAIELRWHADVLEVDVKAAFGEEGDLAVRRMLGTWARARRCWSEATGDPLV